MAGLSMGEAIAMGITQGLGQGAQGVLKQRREDALMKKEDERWDQRLVKQSEQQMKVFTQQEAIQAKTRAKETEKSQAFQREERVASYNQQLALENRREQFQVAHIAATAQEARKTAIFNTNLQYISQNLDKAQAFKTYGVMDEGQVATQLALQAAKAAPTKLQQQVFQDTLKRLDGMDKREMLGQAGLIPADLTPYLNDPAYKDVIPKGYIAGLQDEGMGMDKVFHYQDPAQQQQQAAAVVAEQKAKDQARIYSYGDYVMADQRVLSAGVSGVDDSVLLMMDSRFGQGKVAPAEAVQGAGGAIINVNRPADFVQQGLSDGSLSIDPTTRKIVTTAQLKASMAYGTAVGATDPATVTTPAATPEGTLSTQVPPMLARPETQVAVPESLKAPQQAPAMEQPGAVGADQSSLMPQYGEELTSEQQAMKAKYTKESQMAATKLAKPMAKDLSVVDDMQRVHAQLRSLSDEAKDVLGSLAFDSGSLTAKGLKALRTKMGDTEADKEAYKFLQEYSAVTNKYAHANFGSAQTTGELERLTKVTGEGGWLGSAEMIDQGLTALTNGVKSDVRGQLQGQPPEVVDAYMASAPIARQLLKGDEDYGTPEGKLVTSAAQQAAQMVDAGKLTPQQAAEVQSILSDVDEYIAAGGDINEVKSALAQYGVQL